MAKERKLDSVDFLQASSNIVTSKLFQKTDDLMLAAQKAIRARGLNKKELDRGSTDMKKILSDNAKVTISSLRKSDQKSLSKQLSDDATNDDVSGVRYIDNNDSDDIQIANTFLRNNKSVFERIEQTKMVYDLIPELQKIKTTYVRDLLNPPEMNELGLRDVYQGDGSESSDKIKLCNAVINEKIIKRYDLFNKYKRYISVSTVAGVKPIAIFSSKDILRSILPTDKKDKHSFESYNLFNISNEGVELDPTKLISSNFISNEGLVQSPLEVRRRNAETIISNESLNYGQYDFESIESFQMKQMDNDERSASEEFFDFVLNDNIIDGIYKTCVQSVESDLRELISNESLDSTELIQQTDSYQATLSELTDEKKKRETVKRNLKSLVTTIDSNIELVKEEFTILNGIKRTMVEQDKYDKTADKINSKRIDVMTRPTKTKSKIDTVDNMKYYFPSEIGGGEDVLKSQVDSLQMNRPVVVEYEPEDVIPIIVNGEHIAYIGIENSNLSANKLKNGSTSFNDLIKSTGMGDDNVAAGQLKNVVNSGSIFNGNQLLGEFQDSSEIVDTLRNQDTGGNESKAGQQIDMLKKIVVRTIAKRIGSEQLTEDDNFTDAILTLMRKGFILDKKIRFSFIPKQNMIYWDYNLNDDGYPEGMYAGSLMKVNMYLNAITSSALLKANKANNETVIEVNIGKAKQMGLTMAEIKRNMRSHNQSTTAIISSPTSAIKNSSTNTVVTIPVIKGERLFSYERMSPSNDVSLDEDYANNLLASVILNSPVPPFVTENLKDVEFATSIKANNLNYKNALVDGQVKLTRHVTKHLRLMVLYSELKIKSEIIEVNNTKDSSRNSKENETDDDPKDDSNKKDIKDDPNVTDDENDEDTYELIDIYNIVPVFPPPMALSVNNTLEELNQAYDMFEKLTDMKFEGMDDETVDFRKGYIKYNGVRSTSPNSYFDLIDNLNEKASLVLPKIKIDKKKETIINKLNEGDSDSGNEEDGGYSKDW